jgi:hypothetical protein
MANHRRAAAALNSQSGVGFVPECGLSEGASTEGNEENKGAINSGQQSSRFTAKGDPKKPCPPHIWFTLRFFVPFVCFCD